MSTITQPLALSRSSFATWMRDYSELVKARVTSLIVLTAWTGFYFGAAKSGVASLTWTLFHSLLGIGLVSGGAAAFNELIEYETDGRMRRTAGRPLVTRRMSLAHGAFVGMLMTAGGAIYLALACNPLTGALALGTAIAYLAVYTPLKKVHPVSTLIGAVPGAMPPVLGWTAARGRLDWEALVLFAILFFWQIPHFHSIAWIFREDYENAGIRMLPVVKNDSRATARAILAGAVLLIAATVLPVLLSLAGRIYLASALIFGGILLWICLRLWKRDMVPSSPYSKKYARELLRATVFYLPLLFMVMMLDRL